MAQGKLFSFNPFKNLSVTVNWIDQTWHHFLYTVILKKEKRSAVWNAQSWLFLEVFRHMIQCWQRAAIKRKSAEFWAKLDKGKHNTERDQALNSHWSVESSIGGGRQQSDLLKEESGGFASQPRNGIFQYWKNSRSKDIRQLFQCYLLKTFGLFLES